MSEINYDGTRKKALIDRVFVDLQILENRNAYASKAKASDMMTHVSTKHYRDVLVFALSQQPRIQHLEQVNSELVEALDQIVNRDVYSYLPRKEGVQVNISFDDLEAYRCIIKQTLAKSQEKQDDAILPADK